MTSKQMGHVNSASASELKTPEMGRFLMRCDSDCCSALTRAVVKLPTPDDELDELDDDELSDSMTTVLLLPDEEEMVGAELSMDGEAKGCWLCGGSMLSKCEVKSLADDRALDELVCRWTAAAVVELVAPGVALPLPDVG